jgi:hypothetical protein
MFRVGNWGRSTPIYLCFFLQEFMRVLGDVFLHVFELFVCLLYVFFVPFIISNPQTDSLSSLSTWPIHAYISPLSCCSYALIIPV